MTNEVKTFCSLLFSTICIVLERFIIWFEDIPTTYSFKCTVDNRLYFVEAEREIITFL